MTLSPRAKLVLMFLLFASPITASYLTFFFWTPAATANFGTLIRPAVPLPMEKFAARDGKELPPDALANGLRGKWLLVSVESGECSTRCQQKAYAMRQARQILGREQDRVARVLMLQDADPQTVSAARVQEYAGMAWVDARNSAWIKAFPLSAASTEPGAFIYAVDPLGNLFMRYPADVEIKQLAADLRRVLKASQLGKEFEGKIKSVTKS